MLPQIRVRSAEARAARGLKSRLAAGEESFFLRKERGPHTGRYAIFLTSPHANSQAIAAHTQAFPTLMRYELIGASKVGVLPTVDVFGVHYIKVKPGQGPGFEKFVTERWPRRGQPAPRPAIPLLQGANGGYFTIIAITNAARGKYWRVATTQTRCARRSTQPYVRSPRSLEPFLLPTAGYRHGRPHVRGQGMGRLGAVARRRDKKVCGATERVSERARGFGG